MKKVCVMIMVVFFALQASAFAADLKVAVIDLGYIYLKSQPGQEVQAQIQTKTAKLRQEFERTQASFKTMLDDYQKQQSALSLENRRLKELEIKRTQTELKELAGAVRQAEQQARQDLMPPINRFLEKTIMDYLSTQDYDLVLDGKRGAVISATKDLLITEEVMKYCDEQWKAKGN